MYRNINDETTNKSATKTSTDEYRVFFLFLLLKSASAAAFLFLLKTFACSLQLLYFLW